VQRLYALPEYAIHKGIALLTDLWFNSFFIFESSRLRGIKIFQVYDMTNELTWWKPKEPGGNRNGLF